MEDPSITPKQLDILLLIYRFRFLDRKHIQQFLNHKDPRRIKSWLKDLVDKKILGRKYSRKLGENIKPAVYFLSTKSKRILEGCEETEEKLLNRVYREKTRSQKFIDHHLFLADVYFFLNSQTQQNKSKLYFYTKTDLINHKYLPLPIPDAYIAIKEGKSTKRYFLDVIDEGTPRFMLRKRISQYLEFYERDLWQERTNYPFPSILLICPDQSIKEFLNRFIPKFLEEETEDDILFYLTTKEIVKSSKMNVNIWQEAGHIIDED